MRPLISCLLAGMAAGASDSSGWLPIEVGHRWVYDCVEKDGYRKHPEVWRWTETVTVREHIATSQGLVIVRSLQVDGESNPPGGHREDGMPLLVRDNSYYPLYPEAWDAAKKIFKPGLEAYIKTIAPDYCFPLRNGATWKGEGDAAWTVTGNGRIFRIKRQQAGDMDTVWFERGTGVVATRNWHNGSYSESSARLRR